MYELLAYAHTAILVLVAITAILIFLAIRARLRFDTDTGAPHSFRVRLGLSGLTALVAAIIFTASNITADFIIEPVGGISSNSDSWTPQRNQDSDQQLRQYSTDTDPSNLTRTTPITDTTAQPSSVPTRDTAPEPATDRPTWSGHGPLASALRQERIIVHTANTSILVKDIPAALAHIEQTASNLGGWLVASRHDSHHSGTAAIRVPAPSLRQAIETIISAATQITSLEFTSEDVTEEFIDVQSRLKVLETTETNYIQLLAQAQDLQTNLQIRELILQIRQDIEQLTGRLNYLSDVAEFSLINVTINLAPIPMDVDAGDNITIQVDKPTDFKALLTPPAGTQDISYT